MELYLVLWLGFLGTTIVAISLRMLLLSYAHRIRFAEWPTYRDLKTSVHEPFPFILEDPAEVDLTVVVPAYNEAERMPHMLDETVSHLQAKEHNDPSFTWEIVVVDDGSRDKTSELALQWSQKYGVQHIRVLTQEKNVGKGGVVQRGMLVSRGRYLLMCDADNATEFSDVDRLLAALKECEVDGYGIAVGSRAHLQEEAAAERRWYRNVLMYGFNFLVTLLLVSGIRDTQCGFKLFTRRSAAMVFPHQRTQRWVFDVELLYLAQHLGFRTPVVEVPVNWKEIGGSKLPFMAPIYMGLELLRIRLIYMFGTWSMGVAPCQLISRTRPDGKAK